jgi:4-amino-4-deoxy-L-arabinose transferase-like glycosyltransferase
LSAVLVDPLSPAASPPGRPRRRRRWEVWRSPDDQPAWARPALLGVAAVAALLYAWNITEAGYAPFYSVAVKSMSVSWKAFFYGAFDPQATITIDKLAGSFLPQALSARIFGFHAWSLALPQVIEGVISVLVMYRVVRRWCGVAPGLLAAAIFALTPIAASMFGHSMEDGALTMCLVLAADAYQRAVMEARLRSLVWAGAWVGLGFQTKMLQAWMVLPALGIGYLVAAPVRLRRRLWQLGVATVVMLAVSLSWIALYTFTPAADRPWVDGSTNNSAIAMVFGYNGLDRFGIDVPGSVTSGPGITVGSTSGAGRSTSDVAPDTAGGGPASDAGSGSGPGQAAGTSGANPSGATGNSPGGNGTTSGPGYGTTAGKAPGGKGGPAGGSGGPAGGAGGTGGGGWTKLLTSDYGPEISWLIPLSVLSLIFGLLWTRKTGRTGQVRAGFIMWGSWLITFGFIFSKMSVIPHTAYLASLAPALAALPAAGIVMFWRLYRAGDRRGWGLPAAVAVQVAWALYLWHPYSGFLPWARDAMAVAGIAAIVVLIGARLSRRTRARLVTVAAVTGAAAVIAAPATWAASVLDTKYGGSSFNATAGPVQDTAGGGGLTDESTALTSSEQQLYNYVSARNDGAPYLLAVPSMDDASTYILATGQETLNYGGGFSGSVPSPTLTQVKDLVSTGQLRFFLVSGADASTGMYGNRSATAAEIEAWVEKSCTEIPAKDYGGTTGTAPASSGTAASGTTPPSTGAAPSGASTAAGESSAPGSAGLGGGDTSETLYQCTPG